MLFKSHWQNLIKTFWIRKVPWFAIIPKTCYAKISARCIQLQKYASVSDSRQRKVLLVSKQWREIHDSETARGLIVHVEEASLRKHGLHRVQKLSSFLRCLLLGCQVCFFVQSYLLPFTGIWSRRSFEVGSPLQNNAGKRSRCSTVDKLLPYLVGCITLGNIRFVKFSKISCFLTQRNILSYL